MMTIDFYFIATVVLNIKDRIQLDLESNLSNTNVAKKSLKAI